MVDVPSGEEALLVASRRPVDLLIADVRLPGISGLELMARVHKRNPELKTILITGLTDPRSAARWLKRAPAPSSISRSKCRIFWMR